MEFCSMEQVKRFLEVTPEVEKAIVESGIILIKYWLEVSEEEQTRRLEARINDPRKIWKLSPMDLKSYSRWYDYSRARDEMFKATDTPWAPWHVVRSDDKKRARLNVISHLLSQIPYEELELREARTAEAAEASRLRGAKLPLQVRAGTRMADWLIRSRRRTRPFVRPSERAFHQSGRERRIACRTVEKLGIGSEFDVHCSRRIADGVLTIGAQSERAALAGGRFEQANGGRQPDSLRLDDRGLRKLVHRLSKRQRFASPLEKPVAVGGGRGPGANQPRTL